jgi:hypothetical protein
MNRTRFTALLSAALVAAACHSPSATLSNDTPAESPPEKSGHSLLRSPELAAALHALLDPLSPPIRVLSVVVLPSQVVLQLQNPSDHSQVNEFRFRDAKVTGPTPVKLLGKGNLKDNLFNLEAADPQVATQVLSAVRAEYQEPIRKLVMVRNLPASLDIQFRAYLRGRDGDIVIAADKLGKLLGPINVPAPNPN